MKTVCFVPGCGALPVTKFHDQDCCSGHGLLYHRLERRGLELRDSAEVGCRIKGCGAEICARGLCKPHYAWADSVHILDVLAPKAAPKAEKGEPGPKPKTPKFPKAPKVRPAAPMVLAEPIAPEQTPALLVPEVQPSWTEPFISSARMSVTVGPIDGGPVETFHAVTAITEPEKIFRVEEQIAITPAEVAPCGGEGAPRGELRHLALSRGPATDDATDQRPLTVDEIADTLSAISWRALCRVTAAMLHEDIPERVVVQTIASLVEGHYAPELDGDVPDLVGQLVVQTLQARPCALD